MPYFALRYKVIDDYVAQRQRFREEHLRVADESVERGELLFGGAFADPVDGALLIFQASDSSVVEEFARNDPYVTSGLVTRWDIRPWTVVIRKYYEKKEG